MDITANAETRIIVESLMNELSDDALIGRIANRSQPALDALFSRHSKLVHRFVFHLTGDANVAEETVGDVFLAVWRNAKEFKARSEVKTWILGIARNGARSAMRRRKDDQLDDAYALRLADANDNAEIVMQKAEQFDLLQDCLGQLSASQRQAIDLVYFQGKSTDQVATFLNVPRNTVKTRVFYARKHLSGLLRENGITETSH
jgi:RNA polymerase sigma-70 factor (ECF subfamily)